MQTQRAVIPVLAFALGLVGAGVYWFSSTPGESGEKRSGGAPARPDTPSSGPENRSQTYRRGPTSTESSTSPTRSAPANPPPSPGSDKPLAGRYAEVAKGLTGEAAQMAIRLEEAIANPDRRCVTRVRGEMLRTARTNPAVLVDLAKAAPTPRHRSWALRMLGEAHAAEARSAALAAIDDPVDYVRSNAAWALGEVGTREDLPALESLTGRADQPESVRKAALDASAAILGR